MREKLKATLSCFICFTLVACGTKEQGSSPDTTIDTVLDVVLAFKGERVDCDNLWIEQQKWQINTLAFFMSNIGLEQGGTQIPVKSQGESPVSLVRFDTATCRETLSFSSAAAFTEGTVLNFDLGVPFDINHLNPVTQPPPLNEPDMFWTWRNGYKFIRLDMRTAFDNWAWHLGSVGCVSASAVRAPEKQCVKPNLTRQKVVVPEGEAFRLVLHLDKLLGEVKPASKTRCVMHGDREPACDLLFQNLVTTNVFSLESR